MARHNRDIYSQPDTDIAGWLLNSLCGDRLIDEQKVAQIIGIIRERAVDASALDNATSLLDALRFARSRWLELHGSSEPIIDAALVKAGSL